MPAALQRYIEGLKTHDLERIAGAFAEDVRFVTPARTLHREEILAFLGALYRAFPDWSYDHDPPIARPGGLIGVRWRQGGTHTGLLEFPGFAAVPATGRTVRIPEHYFDYQVDTQGMHLIRPEPVPGGAPRGIFEQIGVTWPPL